MENIEYHKGKLTKMQEQYESIWAQLGTMERAEFLLRKKQYWNAIHSVKNYEEKLKSTKIARAEEIKKNEKSKNVFLLSALVVCLVAYVFEWFSKTDSQTLGLCIFIYLLSINIFEISDKNQFETKQITLQSQIDFYQYQKNNVAMFVDYEDEFHNLNGEERTTRNLIEGLYELSMNISLLDGMGIKA